MHFWYHFASRRLSALAASAMWKSSWQVCSSSWYWRLAMTLRGSGVVRAALAARTRRRLTQTERAA